MIKALSMIKVLLASLLLVGCSTTPIQTIRDPQMNYLEFIARADIMVEKAYPEWYVEDTPIGVDADERGIRFATTSELLDGSLAVTLYEHGYNLAVVEDLASVLLHEYVHVKIWNDLKRDFPFNLWCRSAVHEITAYGVELAQTKINVTSGMRASTRIGYALSYTRASLYCPDEILEDFPKPEGSR